MNWHCPRTELGLIKAVLRYTACNLDNILEGKGDIFGMKIYIKILII